MYPDGNPTFDDPLPWVFAPLQWDSAGGGGDTCGGENGGGGGGGVVMVAAMPARLSAARGIRARCQMPARAMALEVLLDTWAVR